MALARVKTWSAGEVLTASDLNAEFNNILNNPTSLISPATALIDMDGNEIVLDGDADTSLHASSDDQIDIKIGGTDRAALKNTGWEMSTPLAWQTTEYTIISGAITPTLPIFTVDTESDAASDNLDQIVATNYSTGAEVRVLAENASRVVTVRNAQGAAGQIHLRGNRNVELSIENTLILRLAADGDWYEVISTFDLPVMLDSQSPLGVASVDFDDIMTADMTMCEVRFQNLIPATDNVNLYCRVANVGGGYETSAYHWARRAIASDTTAGDTGGASVARWEIGNLGVGSDTNETGASGVIRLYNPMASAFTSMTFEVQTVDATPRYFNVNGGGIILASNQHDSVQLLFSSGNIESGDVQLWAWFK